MKKRKKTSLKSLILRLCVFAFAVSVAVTLVDMQVEIASQKQKLEKLMEAREVQLTANRELERRLSENASEEAIERIARENDYVYPEEKVFIDISGS